MSKIADAAGVFRIHERGAGMNTFRNPPACDNQSQCRFEGGASFTTTLAYSPAVYDRSGMLINSPWDGNKTTTNWRCLSCSKNWTEEA